ncbi:uncharacterized protein LOC124167798 [Ischnura elegans]|uniref:uncharacterized protein LOC124162976 n=1 Tax=Ischnura elegans TaxID=197161 RepID=UPI001ED8B68E|nr:uncharacterized protein LOC124157490 isoform X3 [Ischnura elegans]XP_046395711.1 uncharacterized protein LOC124162976 [Ischnura elegans]XP_046401783.1 uncharacterized protein LOC124167798 [Ischnura elegans]
MSLEEKLRRWGLSEEAVKTFQEQCITEDLLEFIDERTLELLMPLVGDRLRFRMKMRSEGKKETESTALISEIIDPFPESTPQISDPISTNIVEGTSNDVSNQIPDNGQISCSEPRAEIIVIGRDFSKPVEVSVHNKLYFEEELDLEKVLLSTSEGKIVLGTYKSLGHLDKRARDLLAGRIIAHELRDDLDRRLSADRLTYLANRIVELFPTESKGCWISIDSRGVCETGKGKLYSKWYNTRRCHSKLGLIPGRKRGEKRAHESFSQGNEESEVDDSQDDDDSLQWLKNNAEPWVKVQEYWEKTHQIRRRCLQRDGKSVHEYMKGYPALRLDRGYMLLEIDFTSKFPNSSMSLYALWPRLSNFVLERVCLKGELRKALDEAISPDERTALALLHMSKIFPTVNARKQTKSVREWRPSKLEAQEAFVLHVKVIGDLETQLELRKDRLLNFGCQLQPLAAVVGPSWREIHQAFAIIGPKYFEVETPLKAVDITFKAFHALNAQYPPEASQIWQFIQRAVYDIPRDRKFEPHFSFVETLLQDFSAARD